MTDIDQHIRELQQELLQGDLRLQKRIETIHDIALETRNDIVSITQQQARSQRQLAELLEISTELYRRQIARDRQIEEVSKQVADLVAVVRRNQDIISQQQNNN